MKNLLLVSKLQHCLLVRNRWLPYIFKNANLQMRLDPFKYFCVLRNDTIKSPLLTAHISFICFLSHIYFVHSRITALLPSAQKSQNAWGKIKLLLCWMPQSCSLKSSWESSLYTLMNNPENNMLPSGLSSWLASDNILSSFSISFLSSDFRGKSAINKK